MRLLQFQDASKFSLVEFLDSSIPPYAILSHTWGLSGEEVTYQDLLSGAGKEKIGYRKLTFCGEQAAKDGLHYFWIDTCCIDKTSSAELSEAITSMFRWYRDSAQCYVFLSDVSVEERKADHDEFSFMWESAFRTSRWFSRGWTLQELLAPSVVRFFSREGQQLGDKSSLEQVVSEITHIPILALRNKPLDTFGVEERMLWTKNRQTTREEDEAYALLGLFSISMLPNYGEGKKHALKRLRKKIVRYSEDELQQFDSAILLEATQALSPSKTRMFTIVVHAKYCPSILTLLIELSYNGLDMQSNQIQNQCGAQCSDTISTTTNNKLISSPTKRKDCKRTFGSPLQLSLESDKGADELVCDTFHPDRSC